MKKLYLTFALSVALATFAHAQNTFPSTGNVGIGTTSPNALLHTYGNSGTATNMTLSADYPNKFSWRFKTVDRGNAIDLDFTASDASDAEESVLKLTRSTSGRPLMVLSNNWLVANNGNIGINNANPQSKLEITASQLLSGATATIHQTGGQAWGHILTLATDNASGDDARLLFSYRNKAKQWALGGQNQTARFSIWEDAGDGVYGSNWGTERFTVAPGGNVGIGTATPANRLDVNISNDEPKTADFFTVPTAPGDNPANSPVGGLRFSWYSTNWADVQMVRGGTNTDGLGLAFQTSTSNNSTTAERMRITPAGKVGIGTTNPDQLFTVNGTVHAKQVLVDNSVPTPDYVFEKGYRLRSLEEVSRFVEKHKHLPEIASAKEMDGKAVDLNQMNMKLLQKVEELTLYLVQKDNKQKKQDRIIKKQQQELLKMQAQLMVISQQKR